MTFVDEKLPLEQPQMFGLHSNAEIGYLTTLGESLCDTILSCTGGSSAGGASKEDIAMEILTRMLSELPEGYNLIELTMKAKEKTPYVIVCLQESERMNGLTETVRGMLNDLKDGINGAKNITDEMEQTSLDLFLNKLPGRWAEAYASKKNLTSWFEDLLLRIQ